jgi:hypothetical protein
VRQVRWTEDEPVGSRSWPARGSVVELLAGGPYPGLTPPEVPPLSVVNETLRSGGAGGMSGGRRWKPFTIDDAEHRELVSGLVQSHGFTLAQVPDWVVSRQDWHVWRLERHQGVPAQPHRRLQERARELASQFEQAQQAAGVPPGQLAALFLAAKRAEDDAWHFADPGRWLRSTQSGAGCRGGCRTRATAARQRRSPVTRPAPERLQPRWSGCSNAPAGRTTSGPPSGKTGPTTRLPSTGHSHCLR